MEDVLAGAAAPDAVLLDALVDRVGPLADQDGREADLPAGPQADPDDDVVEALAEPLLDVDEPREAPC